VLEALGSLWKTRTCSRNVANEIKIVNSFFRLNADKKTAEIGHSLRCMIVCELATNQIKKLSSVKEKITCGCFSYESLTGLVATCDCNSS
jgi:hypothetical protein